MSVAMYYVYRETKKEEINNFGECVCGVDRGWPREAFCKGYCLSWGFKNKAKTFEQYVE